MCDFSCGACWNEHKEGHAELFGCVDDLCVDSVVGRAEMNTKRGTLTWLACVEGVCDLSVVGRAGMNTKACVWHTLNVALRHMKGWPTPYI